MGTNLVFQDDQERGRLLKQSSILWGCEQPVLRRILGNRTGLRVLDVGCNDGDKTARWFADSRYERVIGLEYLQDMVDKANENHGSKTMKFYQMDVEAGDFVQKLKEIMAGEGTETFDLIYLSFVLLHLRDPALLLAQLRELLAPGGNILIMDTNDRTTSLEGPENKLVGEFVELLSHDPYGGRRNTAERLPAILAETGYQNVKLEVDRLQAGEGQLDRKETLFDTFFSYLPEDTALLLRDAPNDPEYLRWKHWLEQNFNSLHQAYVQKKGAVSMGCCLFTAQR